MIKAVIMAGGSGSRLWPLSRAGHPKQFLSLNGDGTMLQETMKRLKHLDIRESVTICNEDHRFFVAEQLKEIDQLGSIILEPVGKNTAPAIALAALDAVEQDDMLLVLAADHVIQDNEVFKKAVSDAIPLADSGKLVTFGIIPSDPHTGYGYIKKGKKEASGYKVEKFIEKPSANKAVEFLESENYLWNSGMFLFKASKYLEELNKFRPDIYHACEAAFLEKTIDLDFIRINKEVFKNCPNESIDYAVMEKTSEAIVISMDAGWSDIGSWSSLWDVSEKDIDGNAYLGDVMIHNCKDSYVRADDKLVCAIGITDLVVVSSKDVVMVAHKDSVQDVKTITNKLKADSRGEWELNREVYRPWGKYDSVDNGNGYQVKRITVKPGAKLSVQKHYHRAEHWVVVSGVAKVTNGDKTFLLTKNQSTYIPLGVVHALENPGEVDLELIEVQSGDYLGEDDIVRYDDIYGRIEK
jgi:mannose-1-phosphate guanylyltransferase